MQLSGNLLSNKQDDASTIFKLLNKLNASFNLEDAYQIIMQNNIYLTTSAVGPTVTSAIAEQEVLGSIPESGKVLLGFFH